MGFKFAPDLLIVRMGGFCFAEVLGRGEAQGRPRGGPGEAQGRPSGGPGEAQVRPRKAQKSQGEVRESPRKA